MRIYPLMLVCLLAATGCDDDGSVGGADTGNTTGGDADGGVPDRGTDAAIDPVDLGADATVALDQAVEADVAVPDATIPDDAAVPPPDQGPDCEEGTARQCGDCESGRQTCVDGAWAACSHPAESCNGIDDDCDGVVDNGFEGLGEPCTAGLGACAVIGTTVCTVDGDLTQCDATPDLPTPELCDNIDNNCDGVVDEALSQPCYTGPDGTEGVGVCAPGFAQCEGGVYGECVGEIVPSDEICNGDDDDCDGLVDADPAGGALQERCYDGPAGTDGTGVCVSGVRECVAGAYGPCAGQMVPGVEICDQVDNDCNGAIDDRPGGCDCVPGMITACYSGPEGTAGVGECAMGSQICDANGQFGPCNEQQLPSAELCDGADNDCDGAIDNAIAGTDQACTAGIGLCERAGVTVCDAERGQVICDATPGEPADELCNNEDDNCDGRIDDGTGVGEPCFAGVGICAAQGRLVCDDAGGTTCDAAVGQPQQERCNALDDDCDGVVDNGLQLGEACAVGAGNCAREGVWICHEDTTTVCSVQPGVPSDEACDGEDNDCDGMVDEDNPGGGGECGTGEPGVCATGLQVCRAGAFACVQQEQPGEEICDGLDNDCNGATDEGRDGPLSDFCYDGPAGTAGVGACHPGVALCENGAFGDCRGQVIPQAEVCDQIDNDCNDAVDDVPAGMCLCDAGTQQACYTGPDGTAGVGVCRAGVQICGDDGLGYGPCQDQVLPDAEICDGADNDCDGTRDDVRGVGNDCTEGVGACEGSGQLVCDVEAQRLVCNARLPLPRPETCDHIDNDCNGAVDDVRGLGGRCTNGVGICVSGGNLVCDYEQSTLICNAVPGRPQVETCDGQDEDCDGEVDEGLPTVGRRCLEGVGACRAGGVIECLGAEGLQCSAEPGEPAPEVCDNVDNDCNALTDDNPIDVGRRCTVGVGACQTGGSTVCGQGDLFCDAVPGVASRELCNDIDDDCDGEIDEALDCRTYRSCAHALEQGADTDGVYVIRASDDVLPRNVWCDQTTDHGGWTLVGSTLNTTLNDESADYYADLTSLEPAEAHTGIWRELTPLGPRWDVRFACRAEVGAAADPMTVDLSFYDVDWYTEFTRGSDADSCFSESNGAGADSPTPARRDNIAERFRRRGDLYNADVLEGEDNCTDTHDFTVDFDDRGMDGNQSDGTDWGEDDASRKCGATSLAGGQWFVFVRERPRVAVIGLGADTITVLRADGILAERLAYDDTLAAKLTTERYDTLVIGRYAPTQGRLSQAMREALAVFGRNGGNIVTEWDGASVFMSSYSRTYRYPNSAPAQLSWFNARIGAGHSRGNNTALRITQPNDPIFVGVPSPIQAGDGTGTFFTLEDIDPPGMTLGHEVLATFPGGVENFPNATYPAITRGRYCGGQFISANFDWQDEPANRGFGPLVSNMVRSASAPPPADLVDPCPIRQRATYAVCGDNQDTLEGFGLTGRRASTCVPHSGHQVMFITRTGEADAAQLQAYVQAGGIVITEYDNAHAVHNLVFGGDVVRGGRHGDCADNFMPMVQANPQDGFWQDNQFEPSADLEGCGYDLSALPGITPLGGWTADTTQLGYRDLGLGRVWFVAADWQDVQEQTGPSNGLMRYMITHSAGGLYGRGGLRSGVTQNQDINTYLEQNFQPCLALSYGSRMSLADMQAACTGSTLVMACRQDGSANLVVSAMGARAEVLRDIGDANGAVHSHNQVGWYYSESQSMGYAPSGQAVNRNSCDTANPDSPDRLCWHTSVSNITAGWRCGSSTGIGDGWERVMLQRDGDMPVDILIE
jgi:hypothetical protein